MNGFRYLSGVATLALTDDLCTGCGRCLEVCTHGVFVRAGVRVGISDLDACMECGACARNCPHGAITVNAGVGCATGIINEWFREHHLPGTGGDCCS